MLLATIVVGGVATTDDACPVSYAQEVHEVSGLIQAPKAYFKRSMNLLSADSLTWLLQKGGFLLLAILTAALCRMAWMQDPAYRWLLTAAFVAMGIVTRISLFSGYLIFLFLFPLLPSLPQQWNFPGINLFEFLFHSLAFWWAVTLFFKKNYEPQRTGVGLVIVLFLSICVLSLFVSLTQNDRFFPQIFALELKDFPLLTISPPRGNLAGLYSFKSFTEGFLLLFITVDVLRDKEISRAVRVLFYSAVCVSLLGIFQYVTRFNLLEHWRLENPFLIRINSTLSDPNELGSFLAASFFLSLGSAVSLVGRKRIYLLFAALIVLVATILTGSRSAMIGILLGVFVLPAFLKFLNYDVSELLGKRKDWTKRAAFLFIAATLLLIVVMAVTNYNVKEPRNVIELAAKTLNPRQPLNITLNGRIQLWSGAVQIILKNPLIGCGLGRFPDVFTGIFGEPFPGAGNAHNYFLQLLAEIGLIGFVLFLVIVIRTIRSGAESNGQRKPLEACDRHGVLCAMIIFLITSLTGHPLLLLKMQFFFWVLAGMIWASASPATTKAKRPVISLVLFSVGLLAFAFTFGFSKSKQILAPYEYGYYGWEDDSMGKNFRWMRGESISLLNPKGCSIAFSIRNPRSGRTLSTEIYLNRELVDTVTLKDSAWHPLEYYFFPGLHNPLLLRIKTDKTYNPAKEGSKDARTIGVGITPFQWRCCSENGIGFYEKEQEEGRPFAWTKKRASILLEPKGTLLLIPVRPGPLVSEKHPLDLSIYWNRKLLRTVRLTQTEWQAIPVDLQRDPSRGILALQVSETWNPQRTGLSNDDRELGIRVGEFQWSKPPTAWNQRVLITGEILTRGSLLAFEKDRDQYNRVVFYPTFFPILSDDQVKPSFQLYKDGEALRRQPGLVKPWDYPASDKGVILVHRGGVDLLNGTPFSKKFNAPPGRFVMRITFGAQFAKNTIPIAVIKLNGEVIASQPITSEDFEDYFFEAQTKSGVNEISIQFINDFYDESRKLDRNVFINEIMVWPEHSAAAAGGWDIVEGSSIQVFRAVPAEPFLMSSTDVPFVKDIRCKQGIGSVFVTARADMAGSETPRLGVYVDGSKVGVIEVNSSEFVRHRVDTVRFPPNGCTLKLIFENDFYNPKAGEDRNIYVSDVEVTYSSGVLVTEPVQQELPMNESCYSLDYQTVEVN